MICDSEKTIISTFLEWELESSLIKPGDDCSYDHATVVTVQVIPGDSSTLLFFFFSKRKYI